MSDPARVNYNPAMIESADLLTLDHSYLRISSLMMREPPPGEMPILVIISRRIQARWDYRLGDMAIPNTDIVQDSIVATYHGESTITLGSGTILKNYGGMSAVRVAGGKLIMRAGSVICDDNMSIARAKGDTITGADTGLYGPAGAIWVQGGSVQMEPGSTIYNINGRAVYADSGNVDLAGDIYNILSNDNMWQGHSGVVAHVRNGASCTLEAGCQISNDLWMERKSKGLHSTSSKHKVVLR